MRRLILNEHRLPAFLSRSALRWPAWQWALLAGLLHLGLAWLGMSLMRDGRSPVGGASEWLWPLGSSALLAGLAWWCAFGVERQLHDDAAMRERLFEILDALPNPASARDLQGRYVIWNQAAEQFYGLSARHVLGKLPQDLFPESVSRQFVQADRDAMRGTQPVETRVALPELYGKPRRVIALRVSPIRTLDRSLRLRGVVSIKTDISATQTQSDRSREADLQLQLALETGGMASWVWTSEGDRLRFDPNFPVLLRYVGQDFRRHFVFRDRLHPEDRVAIAERVRVCVDQGVPFDEVFRLRCFDEQYRRFRARGGLFINGWGERSFAGVIVPFQGEGPARGPSD